MRAAQSRAAARAGNVSAIFGAQAMASITNFGVNALALTSTDVATYGRFAVAFQLCQVMITVAHGSIGEATLIHTSRDGDNPEVRRLRDGAAALAITVGVAMSAAVLVAAWASESLRGGLLIVAIGTPLMLPQYVYRAQCFAAGKPIRAFASDATWLTVVAIGALCHLTFWDATANGHLVVWLIGGTLAGLPATVGAMRHGFAHIRRLITLAGRQMARLSAEGIMARSAVFAAILALQLSGKDPQAGALAAAILLFAPLGVILSGVASLVIPREVRRHGIHVVRPAVPLAVSGVLIAITLSWSGVIFAIDALGLGAGPFDLSRNLINEKLLLAVTGHFTAMSLWRGALIALRINDAADQSVRARAVGTGAQLAFPLIGVALNGVILGAMGLALGTFIGAAEAWRRYLAMRRVSG